MKKKFVFKIAVDMVMTVLLLFLMALHLGPHWNMILGMVRKATGKM